MTPQGIVRFILRCNNRELVQMGSWLGKHEEIDLYGVRYDEAYFSSDLPACRPYFHLDLLKVVSALGRMTRAEIEDMSEMLAPLGFKVSGWGYVPWRQELQWKGEFFSRLPLTLGRELPDGIDNWPTRTIGRYGGFSPDRIEL